jgi:hypothetical protein
VELGRAGGSPRNPPARLAPPGLQAVDVTAIRPARCRRWVFVPPPRSVHSAGEEPSLGREPLNPAPGPSDGRGDPSPTLERAVELVFPEEQAVRLLRAAEEHDVAASGVFSAGPGGVQVWSEPWNGEGGTSGSSVLLGSVEWTANAPTRAYITVHRCRVTRAGRARGVEPADLLKRVLDLAGMAGDGLRADLAGADPR